jgi:hypothetical protein
VTALQLNTGLDELLQWGPRLGQPYQPRLLERLPELSPDEAERIERECRKAQSLVYELAARVYRDEDTREAVERIVLQEFLWMSAEDFNHAFSQGMYHEWHG